MEKIKLNIIGLANSETQPGYYTILLEEDGGNRKLPVILGSFEAQAIAAALDKLPSSFIHTFDLFKSTLVNNNIDITSIEIMDVIDGNFQTALIGTKADGTIFQEKARTGDAIALAVRFACPIYISEKALEMVGVVIEASGKVVDLKSRTIEDYSLQELERLLARTIENEEYEYASKIRDLIQKKEKLSEKRA